MFMVTYDAVNVFIPCLLHHQISHAIRNIYCCIVTLSSGTLYFIKKNSSMTILSQMIDVHELSKLLFIFSNQEILR